MGTGPGGFRAMKYANGPVARPLLDIGREDLRAYLGLVAANSHEPVSLIGGLAMHRQFLRSGDMRGVNWDKYR